MVSRYMTSMRGGASDLVPGALGACSFFGAWVLAFATTAPPSCVRARKAHRSGGTPARVRRIRGPCAWSESAGRSAGRRASRWSSRAAPRSRRFHPGPRSRLHDALRPSGAARVVGRGEEDGRVLVEADQRAVRALVFLVYPHDNGLNHLALLDLPARLGGLDRGGDDVADVRVLAVVAAGHADDQELLRPRVVRDLQPCFLLNHAATWPSRRSRARASASRATAVAFR